MTTRGSEPSPLSLVNFDGVRALTAVITRRDETAIMDASLLDLGVEGAYSRRVYQPLKEEPALFRKFADLNDDVDSFVSFADRYGLPFRVLGSGLPHYVARDEQTGELTFHDERLDDDKVPPSGEADAWGVWLSDLRRDRQTMAVAVRILDALKWDLQTDLLSELLTIEGPRVRGDTLLPIQVRVTAPLPEMVLTALTLRTHQEVWPRVRPNTPGWEIRARRVAARAVLAALVHLNAGGTTPSLALVDGTMRAQDDLQLRLAFQPHSLWDAMWLQLTLAVDGNRRYERCPVCGEWWDATDCRQDRQTCSDRCRKARSRAGGRTNSSGTVRS